MPGPMVPLSLMSKTSKVGKALASAAKPVTDSMNTSESLLSKRIDAIERLGSLQFIINGYVVTGEVDEHVEEVFDDLKEFYLQARSFFSAKVSRLLSKYMKICKEAYVGKVKVQERELEALMENLEFELPVQRNPSGHPRLAAPGAVQTGAGRHHRRTRTALSLFQEGLRPDCGMKGVNHRCCPTP